MKNTGGHWVVIHMAHSEARADEAVALLAREGFMVKKQAVARALSPNDSCYEVLALTSEAQEARDVLLNGGY